MSLQWAFNIRSWHVILISVMSTLSYGNVQAEETLILAVHPYLPQAEIIKKFTPIAQYLSDEVGKTVEVRVGADYSEHIQYIGLNKVDIAYMGPASYVNMVNEFGTKPILSRLEINGKPWFQGNIIARKESSISSLNDLRGKRIAYGDPNSTMSYIVPHYMLTEAGIYTDPSSKYSFLNSHNNVALAVLSGDFDAGAVKPAVFEKFKSEGLKTIAITPKISEHLFVARSDLDEALIAKLRTAMLKMKESEKGQAALQAIKKSISGLVRATDDDYANLRIIMKSADQ